MTEAKRLITDTDDGMLLIISGPSGVGKTTITRGVERGIADSVFSVSCTTRPKTAADVEGVDYHFVSDEQFEQLRSQDEFLETAGVYGKKYGTPKSCFKAASAKTNQQSCDGSHKRKKRSRTPETVASTTFFL